MRNWIRLCCLVSSLALLAATGLPQGLGKSRGGGQSGGGTQSGGSSQSGGSKSGGNTSGGSQTRGGGQTGGGQLGDQGKSRGGGSTQGGGSSSGGGSQGGGLGRGSGGNTQGGGSSQGGLGRGSGGNTQGGGSQTRGGGQTGGGLGDLGKGRSEQERGRTQGGGGTQGGGLGRGSGGNTQGGGSQTRGGGQTGGGLGDLAKGRSQGGGNTSGGGLGRTQGGGQSGGGLGDLGRGRSEQDRGRTQGGNTGSGTLGNQGRPDRTNNGGTLLERNGNRISGRLGGSNYGNEKNNIDRNQLDRRTNDVPTKFQVPNLTKGSIASQVLRQDRTRVNYGNNIYYNGYRNGYCQYNNRWQDNYFSYPHYVFSPWGNNCTVSPWYYYSNLPAYIAFPRVIYINNYQSCRWGQGDIYSLGGGYGYDRRSDNRYADLDDVAYDIQDVFERGDRRSLDRLVSRSGRVAIYTDGAYAYSLSADDFYDLMLDNVYATETTRYEIYRVYRTGNGAQVYARHYFRDAWGNQQTVMHQYGLTRVGRDYVITDFSTGYRFW